MIQVKHITDKNLAQNIYFMNDVDRKETILGALAQHKYKTVASPMLGGSTTDILNDAYRITNSVDYAWYDNPESSPMFEGEGCRSTNIGDVIIVHGERHYVHNYGFICLED